MSKRQPSFPSLFVYPNRTFSLVLGAALALASAAQATEVRYPKAKPQITLTVPDGWSVTETTDGLELRSPEKDSFIVAGLMKQKKSVVDTWTKAAGEKLKSFGVQFADASKPPPTAKPADLAPVAGVTPASPKGDFTFSGAPSLASPGNPGANDHTNAGIASLEALTGLGLDAKLKEPVAPKTAAAKNKPPFRVAQYSGTTLASKPIDVQLVIFRLPKQRFFVMDQASGPTDGRAVAIVQSVRTVN